MTIASAPPDSSTAPSTLAANVHDVLRQHILADGYELVLDLERSHGAFLHDARSGKELLDLFTSFSTVPLGYNHAGLAEPSFRERLVAAAVNKPANSDLYTSDFADFVRSFATTMPTELQQHLFFIDGGALAVENAMKAAFDWKHHKTGADLGNQILHFHEAFHGRSGYTLSVTNTDPAKTALFPKFDWPRVPNPKLHFPITAQVLEEVEVAEQESLAAIERAFDERGEDIAAILIEPIQGEGGDNHFRAQFLRGLRRIANEREALLIFDEVQTGFGVTGKWWCCEHFDVIPDIIAFGKKTQTCGIAASHRLDEVDSVFEVSSRINSTWGGNLVDMVRCRRIIEIIREDSLLEQAAASGDRFLQGLKTLSSDYPDLLSNARGRGLFLAIDLPSGEQRDQLLNACFSAGMLALKSGSRSLRFRPPLILTTELVDLALEKLSEAAASLS